MSGSDARDVITWAVGSLAVRVELFGQRITSIAIEDDQANVLADTILAALDRAGYDVVKIRSSDPDARPRAFALLVAAGDKANHTELLHIIVDDENVQDWWFDLEEPLINQRYDAAEQWERDIFDALAVLPEPERLLVIQDAWGAP